MTCDTCGSQLIVHGDCLACNRPLSAHGPVPAYLQTYAPKRSVSAITTDALEAEHIALPVTAVLGPPQLVGLA